MVALSLALLLSTGQAAAGVTPTAQQDFKAAFTRGEALYAQSNFAEAIAAFRKADRIKATPEVAYDLAKCHERLNDEAFVVYYYRLYLRRAPKAGDALEVAEILGDVLARAEQDGRGLLELDGTEPASVTVAGRTYPEFPVAVFLPPGDHEVKAKFPTGTTVRVVSIVGGRVTSELLAPEAPPQVAVKAAAPQEATRVSKAAPMNVRSTLHTGSIGLIAVGAASVLTGVAFGVMSSSDRSNIQTNKSNLTVSEGRAVASTAANRAGMANLFLGLGVGTGIAGGLLFAFTLPEPGMNDGGAAP